MRRVAAKVIRADLSCDETFRSRFRSEVERARQVPPFCTAEVLDADPDHATPYLVAEYVEGPSLADVVQQRGVLAGGNLYSVAIGVATALVAIHAGELQPVAVTTLELVPLRRWRHVELRLQDSTAKVTVDGRNTITGIFQPPGLVRGKVVFGLVSDPAPQAGPAPLQVEFANPELRAL